MKIRLPIILLSLLFSTGLWGNRQPGSLISGHKPLTTEDSLRIILELVDKSLVDTPQLAFKHARTARELALRTGNREKIAFANKRIGDAKLELNDFVEAGKFYQNALEYYLTNDKPKVLGDLFYNMASVDYYQGDYSNSLSHYHKALSIFEKLNDRQSQANAFQNIGLVHHQMNNTENALDYYNKSLDINQELGNKTNTAGLIQNIGIITFRKGNYDEALDYYEASLELFRELDDKEGIGTSLSNIGLIHQNLMHYHKALSNYRKSYEVFNNANYELGAIWALHNIGTSWSDLNNFDQAYRYYIESLERSEKTGHVESIIANYEALSNLFADFEDFESALHYHQLFKSKQDSIHTVKVQEKIAELEALYNLELKDIELEKKNSQLAKERVQKQALVIGLAFLLIAAIIIYIAYNQKRKAEKQLEEHRKNLEELVEQRTNELKIEISERKVAEESDKLKSAFLANMSHELRTPMNAIIAFSNFLKEPDIKAKKRDEYIDYIITSGESLMQLIDDIIDTAKIEARQLNINKSQTNITKILTETYRIFQELLRKENIKEVELRIKKENLREHILIDTDPLRLKQILNNLLENSTKYTEKGYIEFGYREFKSHLEFYVKDTGIGIPEEKHDYIFERFSQVEYELERKYGGTGLGLAISKNLIELLGGTIRLESKPGEGSTFSFTIPFTSIRKQHLLKKSDEFKYAKAIKKKQYNWYGKKILVAEDEDLNFKVLQSALSKTKAEIVRASNGQEAVDLCRENNIDLVLMDIQMPMMDGYSATREIKKFSDQLPIIAQTSYALAGEEMKCKAAGCDDYIPKPLNLRELMYKIDTFIS